jgi:CheY-like chemotaxis protein
MSEQTSEPLSVLLVAEDALDRDAMARLVPAEHRVAIVHAELEAAASAYGQAKPDVILLAINELDRSADFLAKLARRCGFLPENAPYRVVLCLHRHSPKAGELCMRGVFDDYATAKPTPHVERVHLGFHRAAERKKQRELLAQLGARIETARAGFDSLAALVRDSRAKAQPLLAKANGMPELTKLVEDLGNSIAQIAADGRKACQGGARKVLIVDDDEFMREVLGAALETGGYEVHGVGDAEAALQAVNRNVFAAILMDLMLPGLDGIAATRKVRALAAYRSVPIIIITGHGDREAVKVSRTAGATDFIVKPVDQDRLLEKVARYVH